MMTAACGVKILILFEACLHLVLLTGRCSAMRPLMTPVVN